MITAVVRSTTECTKITEIFCSLLCVTLIAAACAKVGDPLPPNIRIPTAPSGLTVIQTGGRSIELLFEIADPVVEVVEVFRHCHNGPTTTSILLERIAEVQREDLLPGANPGSYLFRDPTPQRERSCEYAIRFVSREGRDSAASATVYSLPIVPARPPGSLSHQVQPGRILVTWSAPEENADGSRPASIEGYLVNGLHYVEQPRFEDLDFEFGSLKSYHVQTISRRSDPLILSEFSDTLTVVPEDVFPPAAPQNLMAVSLEGTVQLFWKAGEEADLKGYFVFRGADAEKVERLSPLLTLNNYVDETVVQGRSYHYQVVAVDALGNESDPSEPVRVTVNRQ